ncbi:hypothetical protein Nepgr_017521 [Nepenthes gracilis]|uniref:Uncharacterized protein n=1 Tax=Nepenthes gracilis TaxID=150966 RepID=A0AAD3SPI5_NEPGR|nr:hypothetical protein Nepgr_017521 [Nepenthes gracilis]
MSRGQPPPTGFPSDCRAWITSLISPMSAARRWTLGSGRMSACLPTEGSSLQAAASLLGALAYALVFTILSFKNEGEKEALGFLYRSHRQRQCCVLGFRLSYILWSLQIPRRVKVITSSSSLYLCKPGLYTTQLTNEMLGVR